MNSWIKKVKSHASPPKLIIPDDMDLTTISNYSGPLILDKVSSGGIYTAGPDLDTLATKMELGDLTSMVGTMEHNLEKFQNAVTLLTLELSQLQSVFWAKSVEIDKLNHWKMDEDNAKMDKELEAKTAGDGL